MSKTRLEQLLQFLKEEPNDAFLRYAVATEYAKTDVQQALVYYEDLLQNHPDYVPTYYHAANLYVALNARDKAEQTFKTGIQKARLQEDHLALRELQNAYQEFLFED